MTAFRRRVLAAVRDLPAGTVVTYGELANEVGSPGAARAVGTALRACGHGVPWWRVVPASGRLVDHLAHRQGLLLRAEGVVVVDGRVRAGAEAGPTVSSDVSSSVESTRAGAQRSSYRDASPADQE